MAAPPPPRPVRASSCPVHAGRCTVHADHHANRRGAPFHPIIHYPRHDNPPRPHHHHSRRRDTHECLTPWPRDSALQLAPHPQRMGHRHVHGERRSFPGGKQMDIRHHKLPCRQCHIPCLEHPRACRQRDMVWRRYSPVRGDTVKQRHDRRALCLGAPAVCRRLARPSFRSRVRPLSAEPRHGAAVLPHSRLPQSSQRHGYIAPMWHAP